MKRHVTSTFPLISTAVLWLAIMPAAVTAQGTGKTPVPDKTAQDKAFKLVLDIFGDDLEKATTESAKAKLAAYLLQQGKEVKDDPAIRYVCYREARKLAAQAGDANLALAVIEETSRTYDVDAMMLKAETLRTTVAAATEKVAGVSLVELIRPLLNEAVDLDHYKAAHVLGEAAIQAAKKARSPSLVLDLQKRLEEIQAIEKNFGKLNAYLERLEKDKTDGEANLELGKHFGYQKKRWEKALPYFAQSSDSSLQKLAKQDLANPRDAKDQLALADGWWERAAKDQNPTKLALQLQWLQLVTSNRKRLPPSLAGLHRTKAQKRIEQLQDQLTGVAVPTQPVAGPAGEFKKFDGHSDEVKGVALSADGRYAASAGRDQSVRIWDLTTGKRAASLRGHSRKRSPGRSRSIRTIAMCCPRAGTPPPAACGDFWRAAIRGETLDTS